MPRAFIRALGLIKHAAARANAELGDLPPQACGGDPGGAAEVAGGQYDDQFPLDVFQTGSGTSSNMNANEVIAALAARRLGQPVHANDQVNMGQSSNDVIPTAIHVSAALMLRRGPAARAAPPERSARAPARASLEDVVKTGRTHLMDAMPVTLAQELGGWRAQVDKGCARLVAVMPRLLALAQGGTAVGTGINAPAKFGSVFTRHLSASAQLKFVPSHNYFEALSSQDTAVELSGQLKVVAVSLMKIANDLRWMNSGPLAGLGEIALPALQPGSEHHAGQGQSGGAGVGDDDRRAGDRQRCDHHHRRAVRKFSAQRDAAGDRLQPAAEHRASRHRGAATSPIMPWPDLR